MTDGRIELDRGGVLFPQMSRSTLTTTVPQACQFSETGKYADYGIEAASVRGRVFDVVATFENDSLWLVRLLDRKLGGDWSEVSDELLKQSKSENDQWLLGITGGATVFPWGTIRSVVDTKNAHPEIVVAYHPHK